MNRIVTGVNENGRSYVVSNEEIPGDAPLTVWDYEPSQIRDVIAAIDPKLAADWIGPDTSGGARWIYAPLQPSSKAEAHPPMEGIDENGFHTTRTIDFDFIVQGALTLVLDEDTVDLKAGDFVIQQGTRHAWRNDSDEVAVLLALLHRPND
jgi:mannose-6-phosphate isomerase-like protein (cupin superfamily)